MRHILFIVHDGGGLHSCRHRGFRRRRGENRWPSNPFEIGIHDDLPVVPQVNGLELVELLAPLLYVRDVGLVAMQEIPRAEMHQDFAVGIGNHDLHVFRVAEVHFAQFTGVAGASGIELLDQFVVVLHAGGAGRERLAGIHAGDYGKRIFLFAVGYEFHYRAAGVDQRDARSEPRKGYRRALVDLHTEPVGNETHHARRFHPGDLLELNFALRQRNEEDVAADIAAHHFHDLRLGDMLGAGDFNLVAGIDAKTPGVFSVAVERCGHRTENGECDNREREPLQAMGCLFREGTAPD